MSEYGYVPKDPTLLLDERSVRELDENGLTDEERERVEEKRAEAMEELRTAKQFVVATSQQDFQETEGTTETAICANDPVIQTCIQACMRTLLTQAT